MTIKTPPYRDTLSALEANSELALSWFKNEMLEATKDLPEAERELIEKNIDRLIDQDIRLDTRAYLLNADVSSSPCWLYWWEVGKYPTNEYIKLRKNNTVNHRIITAVLSKWAKININIIKSSAIRSTNKKLYEATGCKAPITGYSREVHVELSDIREGELTIIYPDLPDVKCRIDKAAWVMAKLNKLHSEIEGVKRFAIEEGEE